MSLLSYVKKKTDKNEIAKIGCRSVTQCLAIENPRSIILISAPRETLTSYNKYQTFLIRTKIRAVENCHFFAKSSRNLSNVKNLEMSNVKNVVMLNVKNLETSKI